MYLKGVKKVHSAVHHRISYHLKGNDDGKLAVSLNMSLHVIFYNVWYSVRHTMTTHKIIVSMGPVSQSFWNILIFSNCCDIYDF